MTTATFVSITCQACGLTSTVPVDALLVSVAAETSADSGRQRRRRRHRRLDLRRLRRPDHRTPRLASPADPGDRGATVLDDATDEALPPHPEHPTAGAPMTHDDLLALHELLATDTWFDQVTTAGCVNP